MKKVEESNVIWESTEPEQEVEDTDIFTRDDEPSWRLVYHDSCRGYKIGDYEPGTGYPISFMITMRELEDGEQVLVVHDAMVLEGV